MTANRNKPWLKSYPEGTPEFITLDPRKTIVYKGTNPNVDSYSAFFDNAKLGKTPLAELIQESGCTDVYVCGIATDVCVDVAYELSARYR